MPRWLRLAPAGLAASAVLAGCGLANPYATTTTDTASRTTISASPTTIDHDPQPERGGAIPSSAEHRQDTASVSAARRTPGAALAHYADLYINWTASGVTATETVLASVSVGSARAEALQAAASYRHDNTLLKSQVRNSGTIVAITRGVGVAAGDWVVVTRETTTGRGDYQGLPSQLHVTYAQLNRTSTGWVISSWSPQS
jgi:hypothetical protein